MIEVRTDDLRSTPCANDAWRSALKRVITNGRPVSPRDFATVEVPGDMIVVDMRRPTLTVRERRVGYRFMVAEAAWILSGDDRVEPVARYAPAVRRFSDDGERLFGAYGPKIRAQLPYVVDVLRKDPETRQAVIGIWRESPPKTRDIPCTLTCQFVVRDRYLDCFVSMRSSDVWLGVPYDVFSFSMVAAAVLIETGLQVKLGRLVNYAASRHLYEHDREDASRCLFDSTSELDVSPLDLREFSGIDDLVRHLRSVADRGEVTRSFMTETTDLSRGETPG